MQERRAIKNTDLFIWLEENEFDKIIEKCNYKILNYQKDEYVAFRGDEIKGIYINLQGTLVAEMLKDDGNVKKIEELERGKIIASAFIFGDVNKFPVDLVAKSQVKILFIEKNEVIEQKLVEYILKNEKDGVFLFDRSIKDLAVYFNVSRPSLSRVIKKFIEDKVIEKLEKGKYKILSKEKLIIIQ